MPLRCSALYTLLPLRGISPQGETRSMERKNRESYISCTIPQFPPLVVSVASQSAECFAYHMALKVNPVTLTSYSSPCGRYHNPRPERPSNLRTLRPLGRSILRTLFLNPFPQPAADRRPQPSGRSPVNPHTEGVSKSSFYRIYSLIRVKNGVQ